ncbi:MAG TPA: hypothetical protein VH500_10630 [Nitrososphaeraceae archaeon]|jgi:hypothetical protein
MENLSADNDVKDNINISSESSKISEDIIETANNISKNSKTIPLQTLIQLYKAGFKKLVPLFADSRRANVYDNLISEQEFKQFPYAEGKPVRIIYENVNFWTESRLQEMSHLFFNVATTFGPTDLTDSKGKKLYLYGIDIDTKQAYDVLKDLIEILKGITFVVKSHKECGYHFYILTPVFHQAMGRASFKLGAEIEIKTDLSLGTMHLPTSRHRKYPYWNYTRVSTAEQIYIDEDDTIFQKIIYAMSDYLRKEPTEDNILTLDTYPSESNPPVQQQDTPLASKSLSMEHIEKAIEIILSRSNSYVEHARNDLIYGLAGHLFCNHISQSTATMLVGRLCNKAEDEEMSSRLDVVSETYNKGKIGKPLRGISQLRYILAKYNNEDESRVNEILAELNDALEIRPDAAIVCATRIVSNTTAGDPSLGREDIVANEMVRLAESNDDIFFKDTAGMPYSIIHIVNHVEVVPMDSKKFAYHLRGLLKSNRNKRVISNDSLEKAVETLKTDAILEGRTITLHLRIAWIKKNEVICYDLTNERWSCIAIERDTGTWRLLQDGSLTGYPIAELRNPNSKLTEKPLLFTRYSQRSQVLPDRNYPPDIMQQFIDKCTNIKDPEDQLLFRSYIITLFIPDIAHVILLLKGVKGAAKSILETEVKRIIDPSEIELFILNKKRSDFVINLAHNYYNAYDNVRKIPQWLSNDICAATTGAGFSMRTLYTTAEETYLKFKRCFALSSIGASLTEDDALERSISIKHPKLVKQNRKLEEKILAEFDGILPKLLGYIFDILAVSMQIKDQLQQTGELDGKLERMADFSFWGEAAARAMGYNPMEFLDAYSKNLKNQSRDAINFNALAEIVCSICQEELLTKNTIEYTLPQLLAKVRETANDMGIDIYGYGTKFAWGKTPQSLSEELMNLSSVIEDSYGYKIERYKDTIGKNGRKKNNSVIRITDLSADTSTPNSDGSNDESIGQSNL